MPQHHETIVPNNRVNDINLEHIHTLRKDGMNIQKCTIYFCRCYFRAFPEHLILILKRRN
ncbi:hypothetical protein I79_026031 [Cricetulus griseus]|uniref:Uncharacterized protein n=1 Tax=Cricetulus griseus TaxID=10029 RepID=G3IPV0_CRIGR|nr:hypothetical protein I79_026031 [Cricetulus griseus]